MNDPGIAVSTAPARRRWLPRFGLRTLLILVAVFGAGFGYLGHLYRRVQHQRYIVDKIQEAGGQVRYDYQFGMGVQFIPNLSSEVFARNTLEPPPEQYFRNNVYSHTVLPKPPGPALFRLLLGNDVFARVESVDFLSYSHPATPLDPRLLWELPQLRLVFLVGSQVNDEWLDRVAKVPRLQVLFLFGGSDSKATSVGLSRLQSAQNLECLALSGEWIKDDALDSLTRLQQLKVLQIHASNITPAMLGKLGQLTELRELVIYNAKNIDDRAIEQIARIPGLRELSLVGTPMSDSSVGVIATMTQLERLALPQSGVSIDGIIQLRGLPHLKSLHVGRKITKKEAEDLQKSFPHCEIIGNDGKEMFILQARLPQ